MARIRQWLGLGTLVRGLWLWLGTLVRGDMAMAGVRSISKGGYGNG